MRTWHAIGVCCFFLGAPAACSEPAEITKDPTGTSSGGPGADAGTTCNCPDTDLGRTVAGSRLVPKYIYAEDGARQFAGGWVDTKTGEDCTFKQSLKVGEPARCIPYETPQLPLEEYVEGTVRIED